MAPIKLEENIREKLEKRTLEPSANAWQSLEQKLQADTKEQNKNKFWWFGIAAGFIAFLFVVQQLVTLDNTNPVNSPIVVESENKTITIPIKTTIVIEESQQVVQEQLEKIPVNKKLNTFSTNKTIAKNKKEKQLPNKVALITKEEKASKVLNTLKLPQDDVVASVLNTKKPSKNKEIQSISSETSESEIEALLNAANKSLQLSSNNTIKAISVDANALLEDVETEMPPSLRGQLFKVIEKNIKTVTTAVSTRNE